SSGRYAGEKCKAGAKRRKPQISGMLVGATVDESWAEMDGVSEGQQSLVQEYRVNSLNRHIKTRHSRDLSTSRSSRCAARVALKMTSGKRLQSWLFQAKYQRHLLLQEKAYCKRLANLLSGASERIILSMVAIAELDNLAAVALGRT